MSPLTLLTPIFLILGLSWGAPMGTYQDSLAKYSKWIEQFGDKGREPRKTDLNHLIFKPHRARPSGGVVSASSSSDLASLRELEQELLLTENIRNIRDNEVESGNIYSVSGFRGLLPHQKRQSAPYYGRRRREAQGGQPSLGWTILDPVTGREIAADIGTQVQLRKVRRPSPDVGTAAGQPGPSYTEFKDHNGEIQPIHKYYKRYPYSG